jgi:hypothetical protein
LAVTCTVMAIPPTVNHFRSVHPWPLYSGDSPPILETPGGNKDYPLWYHVGRIVVEGHKFPGGFPLYPTDPAATFPFMYPPFAAVCLGAISLLGPTGMLLTLLLLNAVSLAGAVELSVRLVAGTPNVSPWLRVIPSAACIFFVNDMFLLGQPNLGLLCLVLGGLMLARSGREWAAGVPFALAAALKAFPAVVIVYLMWRRYWKAAASMAVFTSAFLVLVPGTVRGFDQTLSELKTWANGMLFRQDASGHGQRPEQSVGWGNQSLFGLGNRLFRPGNVLARETLDRGVPPLHVNVLDLGYRGAQLATLAVAGVLGLGFVLVMPRRADRTRDTDAAEFGILVVLMTVGTPYAFSYYFVWLIYPLTVVVHHGLGDHGRYAERNVAWDVVIGVLVLFAASAPVAGNIYPMAFGSLFWAGIVAAGGCVWALQRSKYTRRASVSL